MGFGRETERFDPKLPEQELDYVEDPTRYLLFKIRLKDLAEEQALLSHRINTLEASLKEDCRALESQVRDEARREQYRTNDFLRVQRCG